MDREYKRSRLFLRPCYVFLDVYDGGKRKLAFLQEAFDLLLALDYRWGFLFHSMYYC